MAVMLPPLVQQIILDPSGLAAGAAKAKTAMKGVAQGAGAASVAASAAGGSLNTLGFRAQTTGRMLTKFIALPIALIGGLAVKSFASFEASMAKTQALVGVSAGSIAQFTETVKKSARETGRAPQELADAMFFVASAGLRGTVAMETLTASAKAAAVGLGHTKTVVDAATSAVNAYGSENLPASEAVDVLTAAVREGKVEADRLAPAIGKAIPVASAMGIEFHEVAAAIAAMTRTGTDARTSAIQLRQIMQSLLDPSRQTTRALKEMGIAEHELRDMARSQGLLAVLKRLRGEAEKNESAFADVFPNIRALAGALDITGENLAENEQIFAQLANSVGDTDKAFEITQKTVANKMARAFADLKVAMIDLGSAMLPLADIFISVVKKVAGFIKVIGDSTWIAPVLMGVMAFASISGVLLLVLGRVLTAMAIQTAQATALGTAHGFAAVKTSFLTWATNMSTKALLANAAAATKAAAAWLLTPIGMITGIAAVAGIAALAIGMGSFGKKTKTAAEEVQDLFAAMSDVRSMGGRALNALDEWGVTMRGPRAGVEATGSWELVKGFKEAYDENIQEVLEEGDEGKAALAVEHALIAAFAGQGDSAEVRDAMARLLLEYGADLGGEAGQDVFSRLFEGGAGPTGEEFAAFLTGGIDEAGSAAMENALAMQAQVAAELALDARDSFFEFVAADKRKMSPSNENALHLFHTGGFEDSLSTIAAEMDEFLMKGKPEEFMAQWSTMMDVLGEGGSAKQVEALEAALVSMFDRAFPDAVEGESLIESLLNVAGLDPDQADKALAKADKEILDSIDQSVVDLAKNVEQAWGDAARMAEYGLGDWADLSDVEFEAAAWELMIERLKRGTEDLGDENMTVADTLLLLETAFTRADTAAKDFSKRYDDLISRTANVTLGQMDFVDGQYDLAEALRESGGEIGFQTEASREAFRAFEGQGQEMAETAAAMLAAGASDAQVQAELDGMITAMMQTALAGGVSEDALKDAMSAAGLTPDNIALLLLDEDEMAQEASEEFLNRVQLMVDGVLPLVAGKGEPIGETLVAGVKTGMQNKEGELNTEIKKILDYMLADALLHLGAKSPSRVWAVSVGQPITTGIAVGILEGKQGLKNVIREVIDDALGTAQTQVDSAMRAINASINFEEARRNLERLRVTAGGAGIDTTHEKLTAARLQRNLDTAKRNQRLGKGFAEDLELAVMEADFALQDFKTDAGLGTDVSKAEMDLASAGFAVTTAESAMRMEGDKAIETFTLLGEAVGLTATQVEDLLGIRGDGTSIFETLLDQDTRDAIAAVGRGEGWWRASEDEDGGFTEGVDVFTPHDNRWNPNNQSSAFQGVGQGMVAGPGMRMGLGSWNTPSGYVGTPRHEPSVTAGPQAEWQGMSIVNNITIHSPTVLHPTQSVTHALDVAATDSSTVFERFGIPGGPAGGVAKGGSNAADNKFTGG